MGRNSSRIASLRIANNSKDLNNYGGVLSDDDDDVDWSLTSDGGNKRKRPRKDRNGVNKRSGKQQKQGSAGTGTGAGSSGSHRNGESAVVSGVGEHSVHSSNESSPSNYENMSLVDKRALLTQICGVMSEHTKKLCTRSVRCPQHTDEQRREIRANLESNGQDNLHVDVDTYEENDGQNLRDTLTRWDREGSSHSSPADSASTTSTSSISRKRETKSKGKGKASSKRDRGSPISQGD